MPHLKDTRERERSLNMEFYFVDGWNGIADFQCRSLAGGVHMILIKQVWKDISLGSQSLKKLNATTRHICVRFVSWRSAYGFGRTNTWSCKAMEVFFWLKFPRYISRESKDPSIKPYLTSQQLNNYGFPNDMTHKLRFSKE